MPNFSLGEAVLGTGVDLSGLRSGLSQAEGHSQSAVGRLASALRSGLGLVGGVAIAGATAAIGLLGAGLGIAVHEAMDAQAVMAQTEAVIRSTGGAAGMTANEVAELATAISLQSRFSDDAIQTAENLLLTFTNIGADTFPMATQAMVDMATAMGTDVSSGAIQLGKALNDPVAGISALSRVGVTFSEEQKKVIKSLVETGDVAGAQAVILAELNKEFGGSAAAAAGTFAGQLDVVKNQLLNVAEGIGLQLLPIGQDLLERFILPAVPVIQDLANTIGNLITAIFDAGVGSIEFREALAGLIGEDLAEKVMGFIGILQDLWGWLSVNIPAAIEVAAGFWTNTLQPAIAAVWAWMQESLFPTLSGLWGWLQATLPQALQTLSDFWINTLQPAIQGVWSFIQDEVIPLFQEIFDLWLSGATEAGPQLTAFWNDVLLPAVQGFWEWTQANLIPLLITLWEWIKINLPAAIQTLVDFYNNIWLPAQIAVWTFIVENVIPMLGTLFDWLKVQVPAAITVLSDFWTNTLQPAIAAVWAWMQDPLFPTLSELWVWLKDTLTQALQTLSDFWTETLQPAIKGVWAWMKDPLFPFLESVANLLEAVLGLAVRTLADYWKETLQPAIAGVWRFLKDDVFPLIEKMANFLKETFGPAVTALGSVFDALRTGALGLLHSALDGINDAIHEATDFVGRLADAIRNMPGIPQDFRGRSPSPFETSLWGIADALRVVSDVRLPALSESLAMGAAAAGARASLDQSRHAINHFNLTVNTSQPPRIPAEFGRLRALSGAF